MFITFNAVKLPPLPAITSTKKKNKNINIQTLSKIFKCTDSDIESISSDEEIYLNQLIEPNDLKNEHGDTNNDNDKINLLQDQIEPIDIDYISVINDSEPIEPVQQQEPEQVEDEPLQVQRQPKHRRSAQAKNRRNRKHNRSRRKFRFRHTIRRKVYHRFKMHLIRKILRMYQIHFIHVKMDGDYLVIGLKNDESQIEAEHNLAQDIFNRQSYFYYRKLFRR